MTASVYPRWRGEHLSSLEKLTDVTGLSPLARGTQLRVLQRVEHLRFIPAGAGNTAHHEPSAAARAVYPRWRGEHSSARHCAYSAAGLSPLARGTPFCAGGDCGKDRFIPAGAGNTRN